MIRGPRLALVAMAVLVAGLVIRSVQDDGGGAVGCDGVREAASVVDRVEVGGAIPSAETYSTAAQQLRQAAVAAPGGIAPHLHALADAYGHLGTIFQGFDPDDPATFAEIELRTPDIEREEARVDEAAAVVADWLRGRCPT